MPDAPSADTKYIFVTGGVVSSLGKGIAAASIGRLLVERGLTVTIQKFDPYINVDPGTMSPFQHGEVYVTDDGAETDLDLGHYERFTGEHLRRDSNVTTGSARVTPGTSVMEARSSPSIGSEAMTSKPPGWRMWRWSTAITWRMVLLSDWITSHWGIT